MRRLFWSVLIGIVGFSTVFVAAAIYVFVVADTVREVDQRIRYTHDHMRDHFSVFAALLAESEHDIIEDLEEILPELGDLIAKENRTLGDIPLKNWITWAERFGLGSIGVAGPDLLLKAGTMAFEPGDKLHGDASDIAPLVGQGKVLAEPAEISERTGQMRMSAFYSPIGSDLVIGVAVDIQNYVIQHYSPAFAGYLFKSFFAEWSDSPELSEANALVVDSRGIHPIGRHDGDLPPDLVEALSKEDRVTRRHGFQVDVFSRLDLNSGHPGKPRTMIVRTRFDLSSVKSIWVRILVVSLVVLAVTGVVAYGVSRRFFDRVLVRRVNAITESLAAIASGNYGKRVSVAGHDEITAIGEAVDLMRGRLRERDRQISIAYATLESKVADRTQDLEREIEVRKEYEERLRDLAIHDPLTALFNRRAFDERLREELRRTVRYQRPLCLMMLDIDFFKRVNDTHGHNAGDEVLAGIADVLQTSARENDMVARLGGEEFAVLMPETTSDAAARVAERLRKAVERKLFSTAAGDLAITISIGVAVWAGSIADAAEFVNAADGALYRAKNSGRNRVCIAGAETPDGAGPRRAAEA